MPQPRRTNPYVGLWQGGPSPDNRYAGLWTPTARQPVDYKRPPKGWMKTLDYLSRGVYGSAGFVDRMMDHASRNSGAVWAMTADDIKGELEAFTTALQEAGLEVVDPKERLTYAEVLQRHFPAWAKDNPKKTFWAGLALDIAGDPLTYMTLGTLPAILKPITVAGSLGTKFIRKAPELFQTAKALKAGTLFDDVGEATMVGMTQALADQGTDVARGFAKSAIEHRESVRALEELKNARRSTRRSVETQYQKRLARLQQRHAKANAEKMQELEDLRRKARQDAFLDLDQYGVRDARRIRELRQQYPTLPQRSLEQAGRIGRDPRIPPEPTVRGSTRGRPSINFKEMERAAEARKMFPTVPERVINPKYGVGQGPGYIAETGRVVRHGDPLVPEAQTGQLSLRPTEVADATRVTRLGKPAREHARLPKTAQYADDVLRYVEESEAIVESTIRKEYAELQAKHQGQIIELESWKQQALNDGMNIEATAKHIGRERAQSANLRLQWLPGPDKRAADVLTSAKIQEKLSKVGQRGWVGALLDIDPDVARMSFFKNLHTRLKDGKSVYSDGYNRVIGLFERNYGLPQWLVTARTILQGRMQTSGARLQTQLQEIFSTVDKETSEKVGNALYEVFWAGERHRKAAGGLSKARAQEIREKLLREKLTESERELAARVYSRFDEMGDLEVKAGLIEELLENYVPGVYENLEKNFFGFSRKLRKNLSSEFTPGETKVFRSLEEMTNAGLTPIYDLQVIYAARVLAHEEAMAKAAFNETLTMGYPGLKFVRDKGVSLLTPSTPVIDKAALLKEFPNAKLVDKGINKGAWIDSKTQQLLTPSTRALQDITYTGRGLYDPGGLHDAGVFLQKYMGAMRFFRSAATVMKPYFAVKQLASNTVQVALQSDKGTLPALAGLLDPRVLIDTAMIMMRREGKFGVTDVFGKKHTGDELLKAAHDMGVLTNTAFDMQFGSSWSSRNIKELTRLVNRERRIRKFAGDSVAAEGFARTMLGVAKYTDLPGHVEDFFRLNTFINAVRAGKSHVEAMKVVTDALFDYRHGLSAFEAKWMRTLLPFYSYQRFAIPLLAKTVIRNPGRVANMGKLTDAAFRAFGKAFNNESLTDHERNVLSSQGYLLDQPHALREFDARMQAVFNTYNSFTPLDLLTQYQDLVISDNDPLSLDAGVGEVIKRSFLSQVSPLIKWSLETMVNEKFFSSRAIGVTADSGKGAITQSWKAYGNYAPDVFFSNLVGALSATIARQKGAHLTTAWGLIGKFLGQEAAEAAPNAIEEFLRLVTGWEEGIDPETGERTVYMSPFMIHTAESWFPFFRDVVRQSDPDLTPTEKTLSLFTGVQTVKVDLAEARRDTLRQDVGRVKSHQRATALLQTQQRNEAYIKALEDLQELHDELAFQTDQLQKYGVREAFPRGYVVEPAWSSGPLKPSKHNRYKGLWKDD